MDRNIHDIFDVILKIIIAVYGTVFLNYIGIDEEIEEILNVEFITLEGCKHYADFLCLLKNGNILHIEFQYPKANSHDEGRFFDYNILAQVRHEKIADTAIFNFERQTGDLEHIMIGKTKCFCPHQFFLGDVDFTQHCKNINIKEKSNIQLSHFEEITLMLMPLSPKFQANLKILKRISNIVKKKELFDDTKYEFIQSVVELEIENFLTKEEQIEISEEKKMTPKAQEVALWAINEVNQKSLAESENKGIQKGMEKGMEKGIEKGIQKGIERGIKEGRAQAMEEIARKFKNQVDINELSEFTGLSIEKIQNL